MSMYALVRRSSDGPATRSARFTLSDLMASLGRTGLATANRRPALLAAVDQHAAAVRDTVVTIDGFGPATLWIDGTTLAVHRSPDAVQHTPLDVDHTLLGIDHAAALAGYAEGVRDAAGEHGWVPADQAFDRLDPLAASAGPGWVTLRLLAVCALAVELGCLDRPDPTETR